MAAGSSKKCQEALLLGNPRSTTKAQTLPLGVSRKGHSLKGHEFPSNGGHDISLDMGYIEEIHPSETVDTGALGPCIGIIIYDPISKRAIAAHAIFDDHTLIQEAIGRSKLFGIADNLEVYSVGGINDLPEDSEYTENINDFRKSVMAEIVAGGFDMNNTFIRWGGKPDQTASLTLHTDSGAILFRYE